VCCADEAVLVVPAPWWLLSVHMDIDTVHGIGQLIRF
jgi:hypothetical protein